MNPVQQKILQRLDSLPPELRSLAAASRRYLKYYSAIDTDETVLIAHQPWVSPFAYALRLYPPAKETWLSKYAKIHQVTVPVPLRQILRNVNGCFVFGITLFGIPPSMLQNPPLVRRGELQCHDLATANKYWKLEYKVDGNAFHFGGRAYSDDENSGYFLHGKSKIVSILRNGTVVGEWDNFARFIADEVTASEELEYAQTPKDWWH